MCRASICVHHDNELTRARFRMARTRKIRRPQSLYESDLSGCETTAATTESSSSSSTSASTGRRNRRDIRNMCRGKYNDTCDNHQDCLRQRQHRQHSEMCSYRGRNLHDLGNRSRRSGDFHEGLYPHTTYVGPVSLFQPTHRIGINSVH